MISCRFAKGGIDMERNWLDITALILIIIGAINWGLDVYKRQGQTDRYQINKNTYKYNQPYIQFQVPPAVFRDGLFL